MDERSSSESEFRARARRQEIVADLGQRALETTDLDQLLQAAASAVTEVVDGEYCSVLEAREGDEAVLRQGVGWPTDLIGTATVAAGDDTYPGYTLRSATPVVVDDRRSEDRFSVSELSTGHDVVSSISVTIGSVADDAADTDRDANANEDAEPWGILGAYATDPHAFTDRDVAFVRRVADVLEAAIDRVETDRRRRERDHRRVVRALEAAREGIGLLDENGEFIYVNDAYADTFRYEREEMIGEHWDDLGIEADPDRFYDEIFPSIADEGQWTGTTTCVRRDGTTFCSQHSLTHTEDGEYICLVRDVTEQRERKRTLRETQAQLEVATEAASVGLWTWDIRENVVTADEYLAAAFGVDPEIAAAGAPIETFTESIHEGDRAQVRDCIERAVEETGELDVEYRVRDANGELTWVVARGAVEYDDGGEPIRVNGAISDITERKRRERRLENLVDRLEESNRRLEQFAYAASHDLQEPLRMVSSYLQLLERRYGDAFDEEGREFLEFAVDGAERMRDMIDGLLAYSRVETGGDDLEPVDLDGVLADVLDDLQVKIEETDAEIAVDGLPRVAGDRGQLRQLFQNLLDNALEYSGDEPPRVHVSADGSAPVDGRWEIAVRDEGIGIHPDDSDRIFEVFQRLHGRDEHDGTGIGLALCQRIVERHGGSIRVDSEPGEGATFSVTLPAADSNEVPESTSGHF